MLQDLAAKRVDLGLPGAPHTRALEAKVKTSYAAAHAPKYHRRILHTGGKCSAGHMRRRPTITPGPIIPRRTKRSKFSLLTSTCQVSLRRPGRRGCVYAMLVTSASLLRVSQRTTDSSSRSAGLTMMPAGSGIPNRRKAKILSPKRSRTT